MRGFPSTRGLALALLTMSAPLPASSTPDANAWPLTDAHLPTPWTAEVTPDNALPEYPRPQLVRDRWLNLNGLWQFAGASEGEDPPFGVGKSVV